MIKYIKCWNYSGYFFHSIFSFFRLFFFRLSCNGHCTKKTTEDSVSTSARRQPYRENCWRPLATHLPQVSSGTPLNSPPPLFSVSGQLARRIYVHPSPGESSCLRAYIADLRTGGGILEGGVITGYLLYNDSNAIALISKTGNLDFMSNLFSPATTDGIGPAWYLLPALSQLLRVLRTSQPLQGALSST